MDEKECKKCGYRWIARVEEPKRCPRCQRWLEREVGEGVLVVNGEERSEAWKRQRYGG